MQLYYIPAVDKTSYHLIKLKPFLFEILRQTAARNPVCHHWRSLPRPLKRSIIRTAIRVTVHRLLIVRLYNLISQHRTRSSTHYYWQGNLKNVDFKINFGVKISKQDPYNLETFINSAVTKN